MKNALRIVSGLLLCAMLLTFSLWRHESLPDLSAVSSVLQEAAGQVSNLGNLVEMQPDVGGDQTPSGEGKQTFTEPIAPYEGYTPIEGIDPALSELLYTAVIHYQSEVDVSSFNLTVEEFKEIRKLFLLNNPELFYLDTQFSYYIPGGATYISKAGFDYRYAADEIPAMLDIYEQTLTQIVSGLPENATEFDKVLYLHDYLVQNYAYDHEGLENDTAIRDTYSFFTQKKGVCQAYMLAMIALCEKVGLECIPVTSDPMNHTWNLVKIDGEWYHVDVTWDDAGGEDAPVYPSYNSYEYFLLSDSAIYYADVERREGWETTKNAESSLYDTAIWRRARTPMVEWNDVHYCVLYDSAHYSMGIYGGTPTEMTQKYLFSNVRWTPAPPTTQYYPYAWGSLKLYGDRLILNTPNTLYSYDGINAPTPLVNLSDTLAGKQIFGICSVSAQGLVTYIAAVDSSGAYEERTWQISTD